MPLCREAMKGRALYQKKATISGGLKSLLEGRVLIAKGAAHNPTTGSQSASLIDVKMQSPTDGCSNSKPSAVRGQRLCLRPPYVPFSWTVIVGMFEIGR